MFLIITTLDLKTRDTKINVYVIVSKPLSKKPAILFEVVHYSITTVLRADKLKKLSIIV